MSDTMWCRLALLTELVRRVPHQTVGRTALMKLLFLLTVVRDVPVGYHFRMYTYGPFDSEVLSDVDYAARLDAVSVEMEWYPNGYGYLIRPGESAGDVVDRSGTFLVEHRQDIDWLMDNFGALSAGDLELLSTIVFVHREHEVSSMEETVKVVHEIKPRFPVPMIWEKAKRLQEAGAVRS